MVSAVASVLRHALYFPAPSVYVCLHQAHSGLLYNDSGHTEENVPCVLVVT